MIRNSIREVFGKVLRRKALILALAGSTVHLTCLGEPDQNKNPILPHPEGWQNAGNHGQFYLADKGSCATSCHGETLSGGFSEVSCTECHSLYPHPVAWQKRPQLHGDASREDDALEECAGCHGKDFKGGNARVSCYKCHSYPHGQGWAQPSAHGQTALELGVREACGTSCHGADFLGGLIGVSCYECHEKYPHVASTWDPYTSHLGWVRTNGDASCITVEGCHKDFRGPVFSNPPPDCTTFCHRVP